MPVLDDIEEEDDANAAATVSRLMRIEEFKYEIFKKRTEAIKARASSGVESRWMEDLDAYNGRDSAYRGSLEDILTNGLTSGLQSNDKAQFKFRSTVFIQKTRAKTNSAAARMADMLFPTDDRNWALEPTPVPGLMDALKNHANERYVDPQSKGELPHPTEQRPLTVGDMTTETMKIARDKALRMQSEIDDQLVECMYHAEGRKLLDDAAQMGTGVLKGPVVVNRIKRSWVRKTDEQGKSYFDMVIKPDLKPASSRVDPWNAYPSPGCGEDIRLGSYFFEREPVSQIVLKALAGMDEKEGYDRDAILACLDEKPTRPAELVTGKRGEYLDSSIFDTTNYDLWHYWGEANVDDLRALGVPISDEIRLSTISAVVVICNDRVIKAILNPQTTGAIPYCFYQWERVSGSPWGFGVPYLMRSAQRSMNAAWRQMQDNAGVSHGPQIVVDRSVLIPQDGDWTIRGMKLWWPRDGGVGVTDKAFQVFNIQSNQQDLERIFMLASQLADEETSMPMLMQGDRGTAPDKVGVATILMNSANTVLKRYARNFDDQITVPHLQMYYDWNMEFNEDQEIKGDYSVRARGSSALVIRDQQKQDIANIAAMAGNPLFEGQINPEKLADYMIQASSIPDVGYTEEEKAENARKKAEQPAAPDPTIAAAQIRAQSSAQVAQMRAQGSIASEQVQAKSEEVNQALRMEEAKRNDEREIYKLELQERLMILELAKKSDMQVAEIKATLAGKVMDIQADRAKSVADGQRQLGGPFQKPSGGTVQ